MSTLLPAMDVDGEYLGVMSDVSGHGSLCAATIVSALGLPEYSHPFRVCYQNRPPTWHYTVCCPAIEILLV